MSEDTPGRIGEQHTAYRRGLVLGLTMAEVGILIIFVLLLLIMFQQWQEQQRQQRNRGTTVVRDSDLATMRADQATLSEIRKALGMGPNPPPETITRLVRTIHQVSGTADSASALAELRSQVEQAKLERDELKKSLIAEGRRESEAEALATIATQEGQLKNYERRFKEAGLGRGERPCWVKPDGTIEYLFDVKLASDGIYLREYEYPQRAADRAALPMPIVDPAEALAPAEFLRRTRPLFDAGVAKNCRFFVVVYDGTEPYEKPLYKELLKTVEGHFYKRLDAGEPPF